MVLEQVARHTPESGSIQRGYRFRCDSDAQEYAMSSDMGYVDSASL